MRIVDDFLSHDVDVGLVAGDWSLAHCVRLARLSAVGENGRVVVAYRLVNSAYLRHA